MDGSNEGSSDTEGSLVVGSDDGTVVDGSADGVIVEGSKVG